MSGAELTPLAKEWADFAASVRIYQRLAPKAALLMKLAFFQGASAAFAILTGDEVTAGTDDQGVERIEAFHQELRDAKAWLKREVRDAQP